MSWESPMGKSHVKLGKMAETTYCCQTAPTEEAYTVATNPGCSIHRYLKKPHLQQAGSMDGDKELSPAMATHSALLHAVLANQCGKDLSSLLKGYEKGCMPASECMSA